MTPRHLAWFSAAVLSALSLSCSDPAPTPAAVGLTLGIAPSSIPMQGFQCNTSGLTKTIGDPAPQGTNPGNRVNDGDSGVKVDCKVSGKSSFSVSASIEQGKSVKFSMSGGTIDKATGKGTFNASLYTPETLGLASDPATPCTFDLNPAPPYEVNGGTLYATWNCPVMKAAPTTACNASGTIVLEFCED
jgi:hypothetical protein